MYSDSLQKTVCKQENWTASQFATVNWPAHERAFQHTWSCKRITYSKISIKLLNTNAQNSRFYGKPDLCPGCRISPETIQHMLTCSSTEVIAFQSRQQDILWKNLALLNTPSLVLEVIKLGILNQGNSSPEQLPSSSDPLVVEAYHHQTSLGWEAFLRGRISNTWQAAFLGKKEVSVQSLKWAGQVIILLLHYLQQLWTFRCGVVHGQTSEEFRQKQRACLLPQVQAAYEEYKKDPFHVPSHWRRLFTRPLQTILLSDGDTLASWLRSYSKAVQQQNLVEVQQKKQSASFFCKYNNLSQNNQGEAAVEGEPSSDAAESVSDNSSSALLKMMIIIC